MLVLARKIGEKIILNDNIEIMVIDANQNTVRIGISAPKNVSVYREELYREIKSTNKDSKNVSENSLSELMELIKDRKNTYSAPDNCKSLINKINKKQNEKK